MQKTSTYFLRLFLLAISAYSGYATSLILFWTGQKSYQLFALKAVDFIYLTIFSCGIPGYIFGFETISIMIVLLFKDRSLIFCVCPFFYLLWYFFILCHHWSDGFGGPLFGTWILNAIEIALCLVGAMGLIFLTSSKKAAEINEVRR